MSAAALLPAASGGAVFVPLGPLGLATLLAAALAWATARHLRRGGALRPWHRASALVIGAFALVHVLAHLAALAGPAAHQMVLDALRQVYRHPAAEALLLASALFQVGSGAVLLWRGRAQRRGAVAWLQALSGAYLALFLLVHVSAVLQARVQGLDTNWYFAAAGLHVPLWRGFFAPYYALAVAALGVHIGCALYWNVRPARARWALALCGVAGVLLGVLLVLALAGVWPAPPLEVPLPYRAPFLRGA